ncbi:hypothetical protein KJ855_04710 [Patescibacteria group bacterium]|nr:hypothetical protein [Patescibacteria group bacterium]
MKKGIFLTITLIFLALSGCLPTQPNNNPPPTPDKTTILKNLFATNHNLDPNQVKISYSEESTHHVRGSVTLGDAFTGNSGLFLATDIHGDWEIVFEGNGVFTCQEIEPYNFPTEMTEDCYDPSTTPNAPATPEPTTSNDNDTIAIIKTLFTQEPGFENVTVDDITIDIMRTTDQHIKGMVEIAPGGPGNAGGFMASNYLGSWALVWHGNGVYTCDQLAPYNFPPEMQEGCYQE